MMTSVMMMMMMMMMCSGGAAPEAGGEDEGTDGDAGAAAVSEPGGRWMDGGRQGEHTGRPQRLLCQLNTLIPLSQHSMLKYNVSGPAAVSHAVITHMLNVMSM